MLDPQPIERTADLGQALLVNRRAGRGGVEVMAAAVGVERARQAVSDEHLEQAAECRSRSFLLHQEGRIDRARRVIHRDDQIERRLPVQPAMPRAVLVQHHAFARLALALAPMRPAALGALHQPGRMQLCLGPGVAPGEVVVANPVLVKMLHVPAPIDRPIELQHPVNLCRRDPLRRRLPQPPVDQPRLALLLEPIAVAAKLPLRHPQQLARLQHRQFPPFPTAQNIPKLQHSPVL